MKSSKRNFFGLDASDVTERKNNEDRNLESLWVKGVSADEEVSLSRWRTGVTLVRLFTVVAIANQGVQLGDGLLVDARYLWCYLWIELETDGVSQHVLELDEIQRRPPLVHTLHLSFNPIELNRLCGGPNALLNRDGDLLLDEKQQIITTWMHENQPWVFWRWAY